MTPPVIAALLAFATVAAGVGAGWLVMALAARLLPWPEAGRIGARTRASLLAQARLAPLSLTLVAVPLVQLAFWRFEPAAGEATLSGVFVETDDRTGKALRVVPVRQGGRLQESAP